MPFLNKKHLSSSLLLLLGPVASLNAYAETYMTAEQAAQLFFPNQIFSKKSVELKDEDVTKIENQSRTKIKSKNMILLTSKEGNTVFLDQVIGKHELITYAVGINKDSKIQGIEILEYRESYGHQIRREQWRQQFAGKDITAPLKINEDIKNLSGATLSSTHVTDGVQRILTTYGQIKKIL